MAIGVESADLSYTGNGATVSFPVSFTFENASEVKVYANAVLVTSGITISPGAVVFATAPASGVKIRILRETPLDQPRPFDDPQKVTLAENGRAFDRLVRQLQEINSGVADIEARAVRAAFGESLQALPAVASRASRYLAFDAAGHPVAAALTGSEAADRAEAALSLVAITGTLTVFANFTAGSVHFGKLITAIMGSPCVITFPFLAPTSAGRFAVDTLTQGFTLSGFVFGENGYLTEVPQGSGIWTFEVVAGNWVARGSAMRPAAAIANSTASTVADLRANFNALLASLRTAGILLEA